MTIKKECYELAKHLRTLEITKQIRTFMTEMNRSSAETTGTNKITSTIGTVARQLKAQFMGYLIADHKRDEISQKSPFNISITEEQREILKKAHYIIQTLNGLMVLPIIKNTSTLTDVLNPYIKFSYPSYQYDINDILNPEIFNDLIKAVERSTPTCNILNTPDSLRNRIPSEEYLKSSLMFIDKIGKYGVHSTPEDFLELERNIENRSSAKLIVKNIIFSVLCLRKIISIIDQIIFQAFLTDKLPILNENNIIEILKQNSHMVGDGLTILIQPVGSEIFSASGDLILVKLQVDHHIIDKLCLIERTSLNFSGDFGNTKEFGLRVLDEQLNPFFNLLR